MAEERSAAGGRTPGPGPRGSGGSSPAAASRIRVDISDVTKLRQGIKDTQTEAKKLSDTLAKFDTTALPALRKVSDELRQMQAALATSGTRSAVGPKATVSSGAGSTGASNMHAGQFSGQATVGAGTGGSSYLRVGGLPSVNLNPNGPQSSYLQQFRTWLTTPMGKPDKPAFATTPLFAGAMAAVSGVGDIAKLAAGHMPDAIARSYLLNVGTLAGGGSTGFGAQERLNRGLVPGMGNTALSYTDATQAFGTLRASGVYTGSYGASRMASVGALSTVNPLQGNATSAAQMGNFFTSQNYYRARLMGVNLSTKNGQNITQSFDQIIARLDPQNRLSMEDIQSGNQQGSHLYADISWMDPDMRQNFLQYWMNKRAGRGRSGTNNLGMQAARTSSAKARAQANADAGLMPGYRSTLQGQQHLWNAAGAAADTGVGHLLEDAAGSLSGFTKAINMATHGLELLIGSSILRTVLGTGGRGIVGAAAGRLGLAGLGGGLGGAAAAAAPYVGIAAAGVGAGLATNWALHHNVLYSGSAVRGAVHGVEDLFGLNQPKSWKSMTSGHGGLVASNQYDPNLPNYVFGQYGWVDMNEPGHKLHPWTESPHLSGKQLAIFNQKKSVFSQTGASGQDAGIWGGSGTTFPALEAMARKGPHEIVTSTTGGTHAKNSYHYKGQAVDLADKRGSVDSPGLLAINHYLAKNYGHKLAELIYAGPGGINIKNGKVVNGMATYGAQTMGIHHNHVHVAATPASLGMKGGVDVGAGGNPAGGGPQNAASSGGFAPPGMGGGLDNIFQDSSSSALFAALSGASGGSTGPVGSPRTAGLAGGASGASGGLGGPPGKMPTGSLAQWERAALSILRLPYGRYARGLTNLIMHESGGNPHSINLWDSNAKAGHPSKGLMQTIDSTFKAHALPGHGDIWNPVDNIIAGVRYAEGRYGLGMIAAGGRHDAKGNYIGYARGIADVLRDEMAMLHKGEMVVQAPEAQQLRALIANANAGTHSQASAAGRGRVVPVQLVFEMHGGGEAEARKHARDFARYVAEDHGIEMVAAR